MIGIGDYTITLCCTDYMLTTSLAHDPVYDQHLAKKVALATDEVWYKQFRKEMQKNTPIYIAIVQHQS